MIQTRSSLVYAMFALTLVQCVFRCLLLDSSWDPCSWLHWILSFCQCCFLVAESCPALCDPLDCSPPTFSVHGICWARILEWVTISFSKGSSQHRYRAHVSCIGRRFFTPEPPGKPSFCQYTWSKCRVWVCSSHPHGWLWLHQVCSAKCKLSSFLVWWLSFLLSNLRLLETIWTLFGGFWRIDLMCAVCGRRML